jgi:hypothetical protein
MISVPLAEFAHPALFYQNTAEYLAGTVSFVRGALDAGDPVAVAVPGPNLALIREALAEHATDVHLIDMTVAGRNPGRIIPTLLLAFADLHRGRPVRIVGEPIWAGRSAVEYAACAQHEALINLAFAGRPATILCPYDGSRLDDVVLADARRTHPLLWDADGERPSPGFAPRDVIASYNEPLPAPTDRPVNVHGFDAANADLAGDHARIAALAFGLPPDRAIDVERTVAGLVDNSLRYGGGLGVLEVWTADGFVVGQVRDAGTIVDPLAGRRPRSGTDRGEPGLLLANRLADLVRVYTVQHHTTVRAYFRLNVAERPSV